MRVLIYIELHPIRKNLIEFSEVAKKFARMLDHDDQNGWAKSTVRIVCNPLVYNILIKCGISAETLARVIRPDEKVWRDVLTYFGDWDEPAIEQWQKLILGKGRISRFYEKILRKMAHQYDFDHIVTWGHNGAVKNICKELNLSHTVMELGPFRYPISNSIHITKLDRNGHYVNYNRDNVPSPLLLSKCLIERYRSFPKPLSLKMKWLEHQIQSSKERKVLVPLQLMDDANVAAYSDYKSMEHFLHILLPYLKNKKVFVKPHPYFKRRQINLIDHKSCKKLVEKFDNVTWLSQFKSSKYNPSLIRLFDNVIGINSSLLFEGLVLDKKVFYLGSCNFFDEEVLTHGINRKFVKHLKIIKNTDHINTIFFEEKNVFKYEYFSSLMGLSRDYV